MAKNDLTRNKRAFRKNPDVFIPDENLTEIVIETEDPLLGTTTTVVVDPRTLKVSSPNGAAPPSNITVRRRGENEQLQ